MNYNGDIPQDRPTVEQIQIKLVLLLQKYINIRCVVQSVKTSCTLIKSRRLWSAVMHHIHPTAAIVWRSEITLFSDTSLSWRCPDRGSPRPWWWWHCAGRCWSSRTLSRTATIWTLYRSCEAVKRLYKYKATSDWVIPGAWQYNAL